VLPHARLERASDWNTMPGRLPDAPGLIVAYGFSGHGFKLSRAIGKVPAQAAFELPTDVWLHPYALERFRRGRLLSGAYGPAAVG